MRRTALALIATLVAAPAFAQAPPPPPASAPPPPPPTATPGDAMRHTMDGPRRGGPTPAAFIRMQAANGAQVTVRCAEGESTSACAEVVTGLLDKAAAMAGPGRGDRMGPGRDDRRDRDRDRDRRDKRDRDD